MNEKTQWSSPDLQNLVDLFYKSPEGLGQFQEVQQALMPEAYAQLLAHNRHMTVTVEKYHDSIVDVEVLEVHQTATHYSRKILLRNQSNQQVVQFGIVRINRTQLPVDVMQQIQDQGAPLGRILIDNQIMRNVKLLSLWQVDPGPDLTKAFDQGEFEFCYGRTAFLYLDGLPVVELLEIVKI